MYPRIVVFYVDDVFYDRDIIHGCVREYVNNKTRYHKKI
jgi:hypothetical protein